jgi:hypothetical protein
MTDLSELDAQIAAAAADPREHGSLTHKIAGLDTTLAGQGERVLNALQHREERDVGRLEGLTIDSVLARLKLARPPRGRGGFSR